ncbi:MAG: hypothetical protein K5666_01865, partial [Bacilli bacterium]|nr:hypothetical protein [Bacilli bacterium]
SHYKGTNTKFIKCLDEENNLLFNTSTLSIGNHKITCIIETENGTTSVEKNVIISKPKYSIDILK